MSAMTQYSIFNNYSWYTADNSLQKFKCRSVDGQVDQQRKHSFKCAEICQWLRFWEHHQEEAVEGLTLGKSPGEGEV